MKFTNKLIYWRSRASRATSSLRWTLAVPHSRSYFWNILPHHHHSHYFSLFFLSSARNPSQGKRESSPKKVSVWKFCNARSLKWLFFLNCAAHATLLVNVWEARKCSESNKNTLKFPCSMFCDFGIIEAIIFLFDFPGQGASWLRFADKAQAQRPGHTGRKALATLLRTL